MFYYIYELTKKKTDSLKVPEFKNSVENRKIL